MEGTGKPEYDKCVDISTKASLKQMLLPGILTIGFPIAIVLLGLAVYGTEGNLLVAEMLGGYMAGVTVSGVLWAIFQNNAGGAWDNAKKSFEAGVEINGEMTYKGSEAHKAAVTGDTVGDPFKDTSGPSMNILIKLTCLIGLVIAPILGGHTADASHNGDATMNHTEVSTEMNGENPESLNQSITLPGDIQMGFEDMSNETLIALERDGIEIEKMVSRERFEELQLIKANTLQIVTDTEIVEKKGIIREAVDNFKEKIAEKKAKKTN